MNILKSKEELNSIIWFPNNRVSHFYFIKRKDGDYDMVDTSAPISRFRFKLFTTPRRKSIKRLLLTHSHPDHAGNAAYLAKTYGTKVYAHELEVPLMRGSETMGKRDYNGIHGIGRLIEFGDWLYQQPVYHGTMSFGPELEDEYHFVPLNGHTRGSTGIIHKATKSIFLGDALLNCSAIDLIPRPGLRLPYPWFSEDQDAAVKCLKNLEAADFDNAFFGHGKPIIGNAKKTIMNFVPGL